MHCGTINFPGSSICCRDYGDSALNSLSRAHCHELVSGRSGWIDSPASLLLAICLPARSLHLLQQLPGFPQQRLNPPSLGDRIRGEQAVLARVPVCLWRAGSRCAAMHAAALFALHRRRAARAAGTGPGAATWARQHRAGISDAVAHAWASRLDQAESRLRLARAPFGASCAAEPAFWSDTITRACCVTLPTMALPPSPTDTFCTVMAGSPWLR